MANINEIIQKLLQEVEKNSMKNPLFVSSHFSAFLEDLKSNQLACSLTEEELQSANVTIERIEIDKVLERYVVQTRLIYQALHIGEAPSFLMLNEVNEINFADFFNHVDEVRSSKLDTMIDTATDTTLEIMRNKHAQRQELLAKETLHKSARVKVHHAIDLRDFLEATLKLFGYTFTEIEAILGGK